jgi:cytoskeletal protein CcmA (bactofilin family)
VLSDGLVIKDWGAIMLFKDNKKSSLGRSVESFESIIGKSLRMDGNLMISQGLRVDGVLSGNVFQEEGKTATVAISESGLVNGNIQAQQVIVSGRVKGNIYSLDRVELLASAQIEGDITYGSIGIEMGAKILGKLNQVSTQNAEDAADVLITQAKQKATV